MNRNKQTRKYTRRRILQRTPAPSKVRDAFQIRTHHPLPWFRGFGSAICSGFPVLIGALTGYPEYGAYSSIGGFAFLYIAKETYRQRALKLLLVAFGMAATFGLGTLSATTPSLIVLLYGLIGAVTLFIFKAFQIPGPTAMFFILSFAVGTSLPFNPSALPIRAGFVLLGGLLAWIIGMAGWFIRPHGPETKAVARAYDSLASFLTAVGTEHFHEAQHNAALALRSAVHAVSNVGWRRSSRPSERLLLLNKKAKGIFSSIIRISLKEHEPVESELAAFLRRVSEIICDPNPSEHFSISQQEIMNNPLKRLYHQIQDAETIAFNPESEEEGIREEPLSIPKRPWRLVLLGALNPNSTVLNSALRYGIMIAAAAALSYSFHLHRSYWVPLSCAAVMLGPTAISTMHRTLQRTIGTFAGILIGVGILSLRPEGVYIALAIATLQFLVELLYTHNYAIAVTYITPSALLIAESNHPEYTMSYLMSARIIDILIGSCIGLLGTFLLWRRSASNRLPHMLASVILSEGQLLEQILSQKRNATTISQSYVLQTALLRLKSLYDSAFGESYYEREAVSSLWPSIVAVQHLGYLLIVASRNTQVHQEPNETLTRLNDAFNSMAIAANWGRPARAVQLPELQSLPAVREDILILQEALQMKENTAPARLKLSY